MYGYYKGQEAKIHYTDYSGLKWYISMAAGNTLNIGFVSRIIRGYNPYTQERVSDIWIGDYRVKQTSQNGHFAGFEMALRKFQKLFRGGIIRKRVFKRTALFKEELMAATWHPRRIEKYMSLYGMDVDDL